MTQTRDQYILNVFVKVLLGLMLTTATAALVYTQGWYTSPLVIVSLVVELIVAFIFSFTFLKMPPGLAYLMYYLYCGLTGVAFSIYPALYDGGSILLALGITTGCFLLLVVYGYVTKRDLTSLRPYLFIGLLGIIVSTMVNIFLKNPMMDMIVSYVSIAIFLGYTAYDTQKLNQFYELEMHENRNLSIYGAFQLYLDFINLFIDILRIFGRSSSNDD